MKPFLLLATREQDAAADGERDAFLRYGELEPHQLHRIQLDRTPMPHIDLDEYSGVIVGGSPFNASDRAKSALQRRVEYDIATLLDEIVDRDFPFFGACYGVGTLGVHQGAVIDSRFAEPVGPVSVELTSAGRNDPLLEGVPQRFDALVGHKEAVSELPTEATLLATSGPAPVQMFKLRDNLYATQFHPELDLPGILTRIDVYAGFGYFADDEVDQVRARAASVPITEPSKILRNFTRRYAR